MDPKRGTDEAAVVKGAPAGGVAPKGAGSAAWERAARDPLVRRAKEAVDGTLFDVRPAKRRGEGGREPGEGSLTDDGG